MGGSFEMETGSGVAVAVYVHAGEVRGRCREQTLAWSKPGWRRAEGDDQFWYIYNCSKPAQIPKGGHKRALS